jgi:hypothetical protein
MHYLIKLIKNYLNTQNHIHHVSINLLNNNKIKKNVPKIKKRSNGNSLIKKKIIHSFSETSLCT